MSVYDEISDALDEGGDAEEILIGWAAWLELRDDQRSFTAIALVDDRLFFKGVKINPFASMRPFSWEII